MQSNLLMALSQYNKLAVSPPQTNIFWVDVHSSIANEFDSFFDQKGNWGLPVCMEELVNVG